MKPLEESLQTSSYPYNEPGIGEEGLTGRTGLTSRTIFVLTTPQDLLFLAQTVMRIDMPSICFVMAYERLDGNHSINVALPLQTRFAAQKAVEIARRDVPRRVALFTLDASISESTSLI